MKELTMVDLSVYTNHRIRGSLGRIEVTGEPQSQPKVGVGPTKRKQVLYLAIHHWGNMTATFLYSSNLDYIFVWNIILSSLISETICGFEKIEVASLTFFCRDAWGMGGGHVRGIEWGSRSCISIEIFGALERLICIEWGAVERGETRCVCENILSLFTTLHVPYLFAHTPTLPQSLNCIRFVYRRDLTSELLCFCLQSEACRSQRWTTREWKLEVEVVFCTRP